MIPRKTTTSTYHSIHELTVKRLTARQVLSKSSHEPLHFDEQFSGRLISALNIDIWRGSAMKYENSVFVRGNGLLKSAILLANKQIRFCL